MWRGNSRQSAIWYDETLNFKYNVINKISPIAIMNKPNIVNKVSGYILDSYIKSLEAERKLKAHKE